MELPRDGEGKVGVPPRLVLSEAEQREMRDRIERICARMSTGSAEENKTVLAQMRGSVSRLGGGAAMLELIREGRSREMIALLAVHFGEEDAVRNVERFVAWARSNALID